MKTFHSPSFVYGLVSGIIILFLVAGVMRLAGPQGRSAGPRDRVGQRMGMGQDLKGIAEQFNMTEEELRTALKSGKNLRDLAAERGVAFPPKRKAGSGSTVSATGAVLPPPARP